MSEPYVLGTDLVISGLGPVATFAVGRGELAEAPRADAAPETAPDAGQGLWPRPLEGFDPVRLLGRKGWRFLPEAARYALAAARLADEDAGVRPGEGPTGVVMGTNFAADETVDRFDRATLSEGVRGISPLEAPNFSINVAASQVSIDRGYRAFNITLIDLFTAGSAALLTACQAIDEGRASAALAGATEGRPPRAATADLAPVLDEGAACVVRIERADDARERAARPYATVVAGAQLFVPRGLLNRPDRCDTLVHPLLDRLAAALPAGPRSIDVCRPPASARAETTAASVLRWAAAQPAPCRVVGGEDGGLAGAQSSATAPLRLARLLTDTDTPGALLQATVGPHGHLVVLALRTTP
ncbi:beta-ketoacyl synthase N-terminal-like domain-containing protein [Streptomyces aureus]|uniref:beta-ketoacyl synthase N-terminal-like domain-containing protein n=1 Tax=Streptomyces aureus TaxID=193461 RepID=UPI000690A720|nr:beta-ketoacyl synthase N-terminal-like domain-containing protein [Streptomyces aureus]